MSALAGGRLLSGLSSRDRRALGIVAFFLLAIVGYTQLIEPLVFRFESALDRRDRSEQMAAGYTQKIRMLPRREARLVELELEKSAVDAYFASDPAAQAAPTEALINELTAYASISGTDIRQLVPDVETLPDGNGRVHDLELAGSYPSLRRYLYLLETSPRKFRLAELELNPPKDDILRARVRFFDPAISLDTDTALEQGVEQLTIGVFGTVDDLPVYVAKESAAFSQVGTAVGLVSAGSPEVSLSRLLSGELDAVVASIYDVLRYRLGGVPVRVLMPLGRPPLEATLLTAADSDFAGLADLAGRTLGIEAHGMAEPLLLQLLEANGMTRDDLGVVYLGRRALIRHLKSGLIEAAMISGLDRSRLRYFGLKPLEKLAAGASNWQSYLVAHADALARDPRQWQALSRALFVANNALAAGDSSTTALARRWLHQPSDEALRAALAPVDFPDLAQAHAELLDEENDLQLAMLQQLLLGLGESVPDVTRADLVDSAWLQALLGEVAGAN
jgi:ABC-type nitrate/sulfonate/bicarbonate transport system substrate-binding protein